MTKTKSEFRRGPGGAVLEVGIIELDGRPFAASGSALWPDKSGRWRFLGYVHRDHDGPNGLMVGTWDGSRKVPARFGRSWRSNAGDTRRPVWFTWDGRQFSGVYFESAGDLVRAREVKR